VLTLALGQKRQETKAFTAETQRTQRKPRPKDSEPGLMLA
jgi:hypothetical protein